MHDALLGGRMLLRDIIDLETTYGSGPGGEELDEVENEAEEVEAETPVSPSSKGGAQVIAHPAKESQEAKKAKSAEAGDDEQVKEGEDEEDTEAETSVSLAVHGGPTHAQGRGDLRADRGHLQ